MLDPSNNIKNVRILIHHCSPLSQLLAPRDPLAELLAVIARREHELVQDLDPANSFILLSRGADSIAMTSQVR